MRERVSTAYHERLLPSPSPSGQWLCEVERFDPHTSQWSLIAPMHHSRTGVAVTALRGQLYTCIYTLYTPILLTAVTGDQAMVEYSVFIHVICKCTCATVLNIVYFFEIFVVLVH